MTALQYRRAFEDIVARCAGLTRIGQPHTECAGVHPLCDVQRIAESALAALDQERDSQPRPVSSKNDLYRKKPVVIEAWQMPDERYDVLDRAPSWVRDYVGETYDSKGRRVRSKVKAELSPFDTGWYLDIPTLEGRHIAAKGDWIIKGVKGELYPCKPEIFAETYEPASSPPETKAPRFKVGDKVKLKEGCIPRTVLEVSLPVIRYRVTMAHSDEESIVIDERAIEGFSEKSTENLSAPSATPTEAASLKASPAEGAVSMSITKEPQ